jgi:alanine racemase
VAGESVSHEFRAWARIDHAALRANFAEARARAGGATLFAVVKADAYGHGAVALAQSLVAAGCERLAVVSIDEACLLRDAGIRAPLLVLGGVAGPDGAREAAARGLSVVVQHAGEVEALAGSGAAVAVHVEIESGMNRMGVPGNQAGALLARVAAAPGVELEGLMTHLACADEPDLSSALEQLRRFRAVLGEARAAGAKPRFVHVGNSAALLAGEALRAACPEVNAVRPGLMLYGARPAAHLPGTLAPVMTLCARVAQVRSVPVGEAVGYAALWRAERATRVATVALGYADGVPIAAGNAGQVSIRGQRHRIVGRVSMDTLAVDVADAAVEIGDEVLIFGSHGGAALPVEEAAEAAGTLSYELLTRVGQRVPRLHVARVG